MWSVLGSGQTPEAPTAPDQNPAHALAHLRETHEARLHAQQPDEVQSQELVEQQPGPFPARPIHDWERVCHTLVFLSVLPVNVLPVSAVQGPARFVVETWTLNVFTHSFFLLLA